MRNLISLLLVVVCISMVSCSNEEQGNVVSNSEDQELVLHQNEYLTVYAIKDVVSMQNAIDEWNEQFDLKTKGEMEDGFQLVDIVKSPEIEDCDVILAKKGNEYIAYYRQNGIFVRKIYITIEQGQQNAYDITYKDADTKAVAFVQISEDGKVVTNPLTKVAGQAVMDCITDAYSNHGWASVILTIESAVIWETAAAVAIACAVR